MSNCLFIFVIILMFSENLPYIYVELVLLQQLCVLIFEEFVSLSPYLLSHSTN